MTTARNPAQAFAMELEFLNDARVHHRGGGELNDEFGRNWQPSRDDDTSESGRTPRTSTVRRIRKGSGNN